MKILKDIKNPKLNSPSFGESIKDVFTNIDDNFKILGNRDFVKGDKGNSIKTKTLDLSLKQNEPILNGLKIAVASQFTFQPKDINGCSIYKWFDNPGYITLIYEEVDEVDQVISSLPYVFKDLRWEEMKNVKKEEYYNETDYSCAIYYDQGAFVPVQEFPTLYYDSAIGDFSWKINGVETGLAATGPQGIPGKDGNFKVVLAGERKGENAYKIQEILYKGAWYSVINNISNENGEIIANHADICKFYGVNEGTPVMVLKNDNSINYAYISESYIEEGGNTVETEMLVKLDYHNEISAVGIIDDEEIDSMISEVFDIDE